MQLRTKAMAFIKELHFTTGPPLMLGMETKLEDLIELIEKDEAETEWHDWNEKKPQKQGFYWFYGTFGMSAETDEPEFNLIEARGPIGSGGFMYVFRGHFADEWKPLIGKWTEATMPTPPEDWKCS